MKTSFLSAGLFLFLIPAAATLADDAAAKQNLVKALSQLTSLDTFFTGGLIEEEPEKEEADAGGVKRMVTIVGGASNSKSFVGEFELGVSKDSQVAMVSKEDFPGLKVWISGEKLVCIQAHADKPFNPYNVSSTIGQLANWRAISESVEKASKVRVTNKDEETTIRVVLDKELLPVEPVEKQMAKQMAGPGVAVDFIGGPSLNPDVVDLTATFVLSSKNELKKAEFAIQYNDPVKEMRGGAVKNGAFGFGGFRVGGNARKGTDPVLGKFVTIHYETMAKPSERVVEFMNQAKKLSTK